MSKKPRTITVELECEPWQARAVMRMATDAARLIDSDATVRGDGFGAHDDGPGLMNAAPIRHNAVTDCPCSHPAAATPA